MIRTMGTHTSGASKSATPLPASALELGMALRMLRGNRSLRAVAILVCDVPGLSKSALQRYESGKQLPPLECAESLDQAYRADGWVTLAVNSLQATQKWDPWLHEQSRPQKHHAVRWSAQYSGLVWLYIKPYDARCEKDYLIYLEWGPWARRVRVLGLTQVGVYLCTGKGLDESGVSHTLNFRSSAPLCLAFGAGDPPDDDVEQLHIHRGWRRADGE